MPNLESVTEISRQRIMTLYPGIRPIAFRILQCMGDYGSHINVTEAMRSFDHQQALYAQGRKLFGGKWVVQDSKKIVTNARPGLSFHCYGLAFDCAFAGEDPYLLKLPEKEQMQWWDHYGKVIKVYGMNWGGDFKLINGVRDLPHAELSYGLSIVDCLELHEQGGIEAVWAHIDKIRNVPIGQDWKLGCEHASSAAAV